MGEKKERIDKLLVKKGLVHTREKAQALIMAGLVYVNGQKVSKAGERFPQDVRIDLKRPMKYVSRGGYKLEKALNSFKLKVEGLVCLDIGASTGGFTDCLLQRGAQKVYAVDVGKGQLDYKLRQNPKVISYEKTDARSLTHKQIPEEVDLITIDVSFIPLEKVLPSVVKFLKEKGQVIALVKPQFELTPKDVKKGVVKSREKRKEAVQKVADFAVKILSLSVKDVTKSSPKGPKGNEEFFLLLQKDGKGEFPPDWENRLEKALSEEVKSEVS
ncbi:MAG TPA: TlyA family RNA methyltransferase [Aquifex aeolicus]|uniref:TlyA family RNA methyltransferase n=1 Tax=Aquifex aeolicus TaxID=63363 RepID=A0A9D1CFF1_AQUAO|nr:TlyA family RNA methyltransferase [Aquificales bacterium]HIP98574.1 TlyA family RNA methyltransferase [Aquifex aeolicus]HIQ26132.1 TlyA family RNA methyltransferase [Aquifex aeolicus]